MNPGLATDASLVNLTVSLLVVEYCVVMKSSPQLVLISV